MGRPREVTDDQIRATARRCFLERGAGVSAAEIARELGVSHTTLFNRFGSKEGLLVAALGPPAQVPWIAALEAGPDDRPIRDQLAGHAQVMSAYAHLHASRGAAQLAGDRPGVREIDDGLRGGTAHRAVHRFAVDRGPRRQTLRAPGLAGDNRSGARGVA